MSKELTCYDDDPEHIHDDEKCCECGGPHCCGACPAFFQVVGVAPE